MKYMENAIKSKENATEMPEGTEKKPKGHHQSAQRATGCHQGAKFTTNGPQREPKGRQRVTKMVPKSSQNASHGPAGKNLQN